MSLRAYGALNKQRSTQSRDADADDDDDVASLPSVRKALRLWRQRLPLAYS